MAASTRTVLAWAAAIAAFALGALAVGLIPYLRELPSHVIDGHRILEGTVGTGPLYRLPLGYAGLLAPLFAVMSEAAAVKAVNLAAYAAFILAAACWLTGGAGRLTEARLGRDWTGAVAAGLGVALLLHPYTALSLSRANESALAAALIMALCVLGTGQPTLRRAALAGVLLALLVQVRANSVSLVLPVAVWLVWGGPAGTLGGRIKTALPGLAVVALGAALAHSAFSLTVAGTPLYRATNGGYNLYAGANPYAYGELLRNQNAEYSLEPALRDEGHPLAATPWLIPEPELTERAIEFAREHPGEIVRLTALKAALFVSPRLANADSPAEVAIQYLAVVPFAVGLLWSVWVFVRRRTFVEGFLVLVVVSYALPFAVTNADPRMRFPLDLLMTVQALRLFAMQSRAWRIRAAPA